MKPTIAVCVATYLEYEEKAARKLGVSQQWLHSQLRQSGDAAVLERRRALIVRVNKNLTGPCGGCGRTTQNVRFAQNGVCAACYFYRKYGVGSDRRSVVKGTKATIKSSSATRAAHYRHLWQQKQKQYTMVEVRELSTPVSASQSGASAQASTPTQQLVMKDRK